MAMPSLISRIRGVFSQSHLVGELFAVVVHVGHSLKAGHYYTYIKARDSCWYELNDENVNMVSQEDVLRSQAFMVRPVLCTLSSYLSSMVSRSSPTN